MLTKALEACGIEGNYRNTCEIVMKVLRDNKESMMAILEVIILYKGFCLRSFIQLEIIK